MRKHVFALSALIALAITVVPSLRAEELAAGTDLEARLSTPTGSRISHPGDPVQAIVIAPIVLNGRLIVPQGTVVSGIVADVERLGLGMKHLTAGISYRFNTLQLPDGTSLPIEARVADVETAKERVNPQGMVGGIYPTANFSSTVALYTLRALCVHPDFGVPLLGVKLLIARSPDAEIYFPAGTEMILQLAATVDVPDAGIPHDRIASLSAEEMADANRILSALPRQRTDSNRPSDLINILFLGERDAINRAFHAAGWSGAQPGSLLSLYRVYHSMEQRMGYGMAPMGKLTFNGLAADAEYQKSLDTFSKRHHLRLWKQQTHNVWLAAATEDTGYRLRHMHLTHATDPLIDNERTKILNDLSFTGCVDAADLVARNTGDNRDGEDPFPGTDGKVAVIRINDCREPRIPAFATANGKSHNRSRTMQALVALEDDIIRSNPVSFVSSTVKLLKENQRPHADELSSPFLPQKKHRTDGSESIVRNRWIRPSVLDETNVTIAAAR